MRVLVVEDERPLARTLRTLEADGFSMVLAANGIDGDRAAPRGRRDGRLQRRCRRLCVQAVLPGAGGPAAGAASSQQPGLDPSVQSGRCGVAPERSRTWLGDQERRLTEPAST